MTAVRARWQREPRRWVRRAGFGWVVVARVLAALEHGAGIARQSARLTWLLACRHTSRVTRAPPLNLVTPLPPPGRLLAQIVLASAPLVWRLGSGSEGDGVHIGPEERSQDALIRHLRQVRRVPCSLPAHKQPVVLLAVDQGALSKRSRDDDVLLHRAHEAALDKVVRQLGSERRPHAAEGGKPGLPPTDLSDCPVAMTRGLSLAALPSWSSPACLGQSCSLLHGSLRRLVSALPPPLRLHLAIHETGQLPGWSQRHQPVVWRLHGAQALDEAAQSLSLSCVALAMCLAGVDDLLAPAAGAGDGPRACPAALEPLVRDLVPVLWHRCGANLYRQAVGGSDEPPSLDPASQPGVIASTASKLSGLTGGMASSLFRKAVAGVSAATHALSSLAASSSAGPDGIQLLAHLRTASALEARRRWRRHGRLSAVEDALWEQRNLRVFCGSWNVKGKLLPSATLAEWFRASLKEWEPDGADVYVIGLQEGVALGAVNIMKDAGNAFVDDSPPDPTSPRDSDALASSSDALLSWHKAVETALNEVHAGGGGRLEVLAARQLVGVMLFVLAAPSVKSSISNLACSSCRTGLRGMTGNKGAVAVRMQVRWCAADSRLTVASPRARLVECRCSIYKHFVLTSNTMAKQACEADLRA